MNSSMTIKWKSYTLEFGQRTNIMGILNVTPDSFSDGGKFLDKEAAIEQGIKMAEEGADIIDIGGESTRPFSEPVSQKQEMQRVIPVIKKLAGKISVPISIDTTKSEVAQQAIDAGASIINDVSALRVDEKMGRVAAQNMVPVILMHMKGAPKAMQKDPMYSDLMGEIKAFLSDAAERAKAFGISASKIIIDPGIGFGKTFEHNFIILNRLKELKELGFPLLVGASRKAFIRNLLQDKSKNQFTPDHPVIELGSRATAAAAILNGAHIVRVHDVEKTLATVKVIDAVKRAG